MLIQFQNYLTLENIYLWTNFGVLPFWLMLIIIPNSKVDHLGASAVDPVYSIEVELSRNWHWMWSSFYYNKKHNGFFIAVLKILSKFFSSLVKLIFYFVTFNKIKKLIHKQRLSGIVNAIFGKKSWYRPKIPN